MKIKLSDSSPRKLLPFFRGGTAPSSRSMTTVNNSGSTNSASASAGKGRKTEISTETRDKLKMKEQKNDVNTGMEKNCALVVRSGRGKRKSECLEEWNASSSSSHSHTHRWNSKRAKKANKAGAISAELPDCLCEVVGDTNAVVKYVEDPDQELWESMVEMIVGNGLWELHNLECLLYCYLSLNDSPLHHTIERTFLRVLCDLERTS